MRKFWEQSELRFALLFIVVYVIANSFLNQASDSLGVEQAVTLPFNLALIALLLVFIRRNGLRAYYGLCAPKVPAARMLFYIPALLVATVNIWFGFAMNKKPVPDGVVYFVAMLATGVAEELIFRGLLFRAMEKTNPRAAIGLTSVLFGFGHIVNLFNGSGMDTLSTVCQVCYAVAVGFLLAGLLVKGKSLLPCIVTHSLFNALSLFANQPMFDQYEIPVAAVLCLLSLAAAIYYLKTAEKEKDHAEH